MLFVEWRRPINQLNHHQYRQFRSPGLHSVHFRIRTAASNEQVYIIDKLVVKSSKWLIMAHSASELAEEAPAKLSSCYSA